MIDKVYDQAAGFSKALNAFGEALEHDIGQVNRKAAIDLYKSIVDKTPIDTGRLRAAWQIDTVLYNTPPPDNNMTFREIEQSNNTSIMEFSFKNSDDEIWLFNNVEYASYIEDGTSDQAPHGMLAVALAEFKGYYKRRARELGFESI